MKIKLKGFPHRFMNTLAKKCLHQKKCDKPLEIFSKNKISLSVLMKGNKNT